MATTLLQLRDRAKQESDNVNSSFLTDAEWNTNINASYFELYGLLVTAYGNDYAVQSPSSGFTIATDGVNEFFALPSDFFKLLGVDLQLTTGNYLTLKPFQFSERNAWTPYNNQIPAAGQTVRVFYVPKLTPLAADGSTLEGVNGWEEYIIVDAALKALAKEESDVSVMAARKAALLQRLNDEMEARDTGMPMRVADTLYNQSRSMRYRLNGNNLWLRGNGQADVFPWEGSNGGPWW